jgi:hypothetical protein
VIVKEGLFRKEKEKRNASRTVSAAAAGLVRALWCSHAPLSSVT